jgi:NAD-dependent DNA ligase
MAKGQGAALAVEDKESTKETLQRQMEEARDSISQTVTDIKDTVVDQVQSVKETVAETLDWHEQFRSHPVAWCIGALSIGYVIGKSASAAFKGTKDDDALLSHLAALGEHFTDELSRQGMNLLAPALTGTVLVPVLTGKLKEMTGMDFSDLANQLLAQNGAGVKKSKKKKASGKKKGKKKRARSKDI